MAIYPSKKKKKNTDLGGAQLWNKSLFAIVYTHSVLRFYFISLPGRDETIDVLRPSGYIMTAVSKAMGVINKGVHLSGAILFTYSLYYYYVYVNIPVHLNPLDEAIGGKFKYLTFCNMVSGCIHPTRSLGVKADRLAEKLTPT